MFKKDLYAGFVHTLTCTCIFMSYIMNDMHPMFNAPCSMLNAQCFNAQSHETWSQCVCWDFYFYFVLNLLPFSLFHISVDRKQNVDLILNAWEDFPFEMSVEWYVIAEFRQNVICSSVQAIFVFLVIFFRRAVFFFFFYSDFFFSCIYPPLSGDLYL